MSVILISESFRNNNTIIVSQQVALILARGGSKGIPLKNLAKLGGKSLLCRSIQTLQEVSGKYSGLYVSTDHPLIAQEAETCNATVHWRSAETATDETTSLESVQEFLGKHPEVERVALIQCTSPFTQAEYLHEAFELTEECVFAVRRSHEFRWTKRDGQVIPLNLNPLKRPRRQDWRGELVETGMFYFATRQLILSGSFQSNR